MKKYVFSKHRGVEDIENIFSNAIVFPSEVRGLRDAIYMLFSA